MKQRIPRCRDGFTRFCSTEELPLMMMGKRFAQKVTHLQLGCASAGCEKKREKERKLERDQGRVERE